jgi:hypothetical protein
MSRDEHALRSPDDLEDFVQDHEVGILDVLQAYDGAASAYTVAVATPWDPSVVVASTTSPVPVQRG